MARLQPQLCCKNLQEEMHDEFRDLLVDARKQRLQPHRLTLFNAPRLAICSSEVKHCCLAFKYIDHPWLATSYHAVLVALILVGC